MRVNNRDFVWCIRTSDYTGYPELRVTSLDKQFSVQYGLNQKCETRLRIVGREFRCKSFPEPTGNWVECPRWDTEGIVTPGDIRRLIEWCLYTDAPRIWVDWRGDRIETTA